MKSDFYSVLGVDPKADATEIRKAYRKRVLEFHPDRNADNPAAEETFKKIQQAYQTLSDPEERREYDVSREAFQSYSAAPPNREPSPRPRKPAAKRERVEWRKRARADWELDPDLVDNEFEARDILVGVILGAISYLWVCPFYVNDPGETSVLWYFLWAIGPVLGGCVLFYKLGQGLRDLTGSVFSALPGSISIWEALLKLLPLALAVFGAWLSVRSAAYLDIVLPTRGLVGATICSGLAGAFGGAFGRAFTLVAVQPAAKLFGVAVGMLLGGLSGGGLSFFVVSVSSNPGLDNAFFSALSLGTLAAVIGGAVGSAIGSLRK